MTINYSYLQLYRTITASEYGQILKDNIRFGRFKPKNIKNSTWEKILGPDVNNLRHMWFTKKLVDKFLNYSPKNQFSSTDQHLLRLTATFHDLAESIVGDIPKVNKNLDEERYEKTVLLQIVEEMSKINKQFKIAKSDILYSIEHIIFPTLPNFLSQAFTTIEYLGYLHTACSAKISSSLRRNNNPTQRQLTLLSQEVIPNSLAKLEQQPLFLPTINRLLHIQPYSEVLGRNHHAANTVVIGTANTSPILPVNVRTISSATIS